MGKRRSNYMGQQACRLLPAMVTSIQVSVMDVELFSMIVEAMGYRACGTQGVPLRATPLSCSRILRITATTEMLPGLPR